MASDECLRRLRRLHQHLEATGTVPIDREANRWLGEATAIVDDLVTDPPSGVVIADRLDTVAELLSHVDETGHPQADEHLQRAAEIVDELRKGDRR